MDEAGKGSNAMLAAIVAVVAIVGLVVLWSMMRGPAGGGSPLGQGSVFPCTSSQIEDKDTDGSSVQKSGVSCTLTSTDCNDDPRNGARSRPGLKESCDNLDNDCDDTNHADGVTASAIDDGCDDDSDDYCDKNLMVYGGSTSCPLTIPSTTTKEVPSNDCNDDPATGGSAMKPGAPETCNNKDDDCDLSVDESLTQACGTDVGECVAGMQACSAGTWGTCSGSVGPTTEICDGVDNDCDGATDEGCDDDNDNYCEALMAKADPYPSWCTAAYAPYCCPNVGNDCKDNLPDIHPGSPDVCDNVDNNCDAIVDNVVYADHVVYVEDSSCPTCQEISDGDNNPLVGGQNEGMSYVQSSPSSPPSTYYTDADSCAPNTAMIQEKLCAVGQYGGKISGIAIVYCPAGTSCHDPDGPTAATCVSAPG